jgi:uncharacterized membrane protein YgcG
MYLLKKIHPQVMKKYFSVIILLFGFTICFSQGFTIDSIITSMAVKKSGDVIVTENIYTNFNEIKHGIYRMIPYVFTNNGSTYRTRLNNINVNNYQFQSSRENGNYKIRIGDPNVKVTGQHKYSISYTIEGPFIDMQSFQELYWNIVGNDWPTSINYASCRIEFEEDFTDQQLAVYTGRQKEVNKAAFISKTDNVITAYTSKPLEPGEGFTLAIMLPANYIAADKVMKVEVPKPKPAPIPLSSQWPWAAIILSPVAYLYYLRKKHKSEEDDFYKKITPKAYPPLDLTPAEVGTFHDNIVHDRDVISLIPYWGYQGHLRMEHDRNYGDTYITKVSELSTGRPPYEYKLFDAIFSYGNSVPLSTLKNNFYQEFSMVKSMVKKELNQLSMYDENYSYWFKSWRMILLSLVFIPVLIFAFIKGYLMVGVAAIIGLMAVIVLTTLSYKLTEKGQRVNQDLLGFYTFLKNKDDYDYSQLIKDDPKYFEKVFPYAVAFGLDKRLVQRMTPFQTAAPMWYGMYGMPMSTQPMTDFGENFSPKEISSAFSSYPVSSSGGSSSGGGFSGGGFGGGGGGSW